MINDKVPWYIRDWLACIVDYHGNVIHVIGYNRLNGRVLAHSPEIPHFEFSYLEQTGA
jgi:hypothetical protein